MIKNSTKNGRCSQDCSHFLFLTTYTQLVAELCDKILSSLESQTVYFTSVDENDESQFEWWRREILLDFWSLLFLPFFFVLGIGNRTCLRVGSI